MTTGHPAAMADAVSLPKTLNANGKLLAPKTGDRPERDVDAADEGGRRCGLVDDSTEVGALDGHPRVEPHLTRRTSDLAAES